MSQWNNGNGNGNGMFQNQNQGYQTPAMGNVLNRMQQQSQMFNLPHYESPTLHGRIEAEQFLMGPNSSIFLPDAEEDVIWWIRTDGAGNKSVNDFDINPRKKPEQIDINELAARLTAMEERFNAKFNKSNAKRSNAAANANIGADATIE